MTQVLLPLLAFVVAAGVLTITPGVDTAMVLRSSTAGGPRRGIAAALGICLGLLLWGSGAAFGLTALLATSTLGFTIVKWLGTAYLVWLGARLIARPRAALSMETPALGSGLRGGRGSAFRRGLLTNILNPKIGVFYITFLPQFIPRHSHINVAGFTLLLAAIHVLLSLAWFAVLIAATVPLGRLLSKPRVVRNLDRLTGAVFVGFGLKLALAKRP